MDFQTNGTASGTILYTYDPNAAAAGIFIGLFGLAGVGHFIGLIWLRTPFFIPLLIGCIMEAFGYYGRLWSSRSPFDFGAFILQSFMLVLAPLFISATVYMSLSRVLHVLEPPSSSTNTSESKPKPRRSCCFRCCCCCCLSLSRRRGQPRAWMSPIFILSDVGCFITQLAGLGMQATTSSSLRQTGRAVLVVGLALQCVITLIFSIVVLRHAARLRTWSHGRGRNNGSSNRSSNPSERRQSDSDERENDSHGHQDASNGRQHRSNGRHDDSDDHQSDGHQDQCDGRRYVVALAVAAALLLLRNIVRVAEYAQGAMGYVAAREAFVYLCDAAPVLGVLLLGAVYHPGRLGRAARREARLAERVVMVERAGRAFGEGRVGGL